MDPLHDPVTWYKITHAGTETNYTLSLFVFLLRLIYLQNMSETDFSTGAAERQFLVNFYKQLLLTVPKG